MLRASGRSRPRAPSQLLEVQHDGFVRAQEVGKDLVAGSTVTLLPWAVAQERPQAIADVGRQDTFEVLECRSAQSRVVGMKAAIRDLQRSRGEYEREQREDMSQTLPCAVLQELVHERSRVCVHGIEEAMALPYRTSDRDLAADDVEDAFLVDADARVLLDDRGERSSALELAAPELNALGVGCLGVGSL